MSVDIAGPSSSKELEIVVAEKRVPENKLIVPGATVTSNPDFMRLILLKRNKIYF